MTEVIGSLGSLLLAACALPQVIKTYRTRSAADLSWGFLLMWLGGEVTTSIYLLRNNIGTGNFQYPLYLNYGFNLVMVCLLVSAKASYDSRR